MYKQEHIRWNQWALFFFGTLASLSIAWAKLPAIVPLWIPALIAFFLNCAWFMTALSIRATTDAWESVIRRLEDNNNLDEKPFHMFREELKKQDSRWNDLYKTIAFWRRIWWREYMFSVTRVLTLIGLLLAISFLTLAVAGATGLLSKSQRAVTQFAGDRADGGGP